MHCPATPGGMPSAPGTGYARKHPLLGTDSHFISVAVRRLYEHGLTEQSHRAARTVLEKKIS